MAYSLAEELDESDLAILITFGYLILANLNILVTKQSLKQASQTDDEEGDDEIDVFDSITISSRSNRKSKSKKRRIKRKNNSK